MSLEKSTCDVVIVGGGPIGLYLAGKLLQKGLEVRVLEKKRQIDLHSKSLGIHPVSMELFEEAGISEPFLQKGIKIKKGTAFINSDRIGEISFEECAKPFNYILALPQFQTETILQKWIDTLSSDTIIRGANVTNLKQYSEKVTATFQYNGEKHEIQAAFAAGCDGAKSFVRKQAGISFEGSAYPDTYIMGDFTDNTEFGTNAAVYLHKEGLIESFPLPGSHRRWVVKTNSYYKNPARNHIEDLVYQRIGHSLKNQENSMMSSFGVQHKIAGSLHSGRIFLAGDSAHVVSPIGGQGMNLGWLTAERLFQVILQSLKNPERTDHYASEFTRKSRKAAKITAKRAEVNMWLGRKHRFPFITKALVSLIVNTPVSARAAKIFTMRGI
ncbi:MAG: FAD-dependent monooxygenase [Balneolaceae bacterium]